jgi:predicted DsbA family dithiol-disulfide isomerase
MKEMQGRLKRVADEAGLPFAERVKTYNSRLAQELGKWAESKNNGDEFHHAAFRAYFVDGTNIAKIPELVEIAASAGLDREEAETVLINRPFKPNVDEDWLLAKKTGITAVPTFVMNGGSLVGAQPYEMLVELMKSKGVKRR